MKKVWTCADRWKAIEIKCSNIWIIMIILTRQFYILYTFKIEKTLNFQAAPLEQMLKKSYLVKLG